MTSKKDQLTLLHRLQETLGGKEADTLMELLAVDHTADITELRSDVSMLKTDVSVLKADVAVLKTDIESLREDVTQLRIAIVHFESSVIRSLNRHLTFSVSAMMSINTLMVGAVALLR